MTPAPHTQSINGYTFRMLPVAGGTFLMGSTKDEKDAGGDEMPQHEVNIPDFLMGEFPATQALWKAVMDGENPSYFQGDDRPVEQVSWLDVTEKFLPALRHQTGLSYRLPSEAEWEYVARGGPYHSEGFRYAGSDRLKDVGWFEENNDVETRPVGQKQPNQLGLYDMSGNVWEWCEDDWHGSYKGTPKNGKPWVDAPRGSHRVRRGGSLISIAEFCRVASHLNYAPGFSGNNTGFRLVVSLQSDGSPLPAFL